jgi:hypothetical protein
MRTASLVMFASLFLSLLGGCAGAGDVGLQVRPGPTGEAPAAAEAATTGPPVGAPGPAMTPGNAGDASPPATPRALPTSTAALDGPELAPPPAAGDVPASGEEYTFDPSLWQASLASLGSFRQKAVLNFTAESGVRSRVTYEGEVTLEPNAFHSVVRVEGQGAAHLPSNQVEVTWIEDRVWVKLGFKPWVTVPATAVQDMYGGEVVGVADLLPFVRGAGRLMPDETVNGIPSRHYAYDLDNLQPDVRMSSARGDLWVARDGGYVVRLTLEGQGTYYDTYTASGTLRLIYDLYDVGVPLTIDPPR